MSCFQGVKSSFTGTFLFGARSSQIIQPLSVVKQALQTNICLEVKEALQTNICLEVKAGVIY